MLAKSTLTAFACGTAFLMASAIMQWLESSGIARSMSSVVTEIATRPSFGSDLSLFVSMRKILTDDMSGVCKNLTHDLISVVPGPPANMVPLPGGG